VNVYLLLIDEERYFFYSAEDEEEDANKDKADGLDGGDLVGVGSGGSWTSRLTSWLSGRLARFKDSWQHAEGGMLGKVHRCWDWLHTFIHPQESMLGRLYWVKRIDLFYPSSRSNDIQAIWDGYLRGRYWYHVFWMGGNTVVAIPTVSFLWALPGPNFIGYWFAYRAIHHCLIVLGIRRARREEVPTSMIPSEALDRPVNRDAAGKAAHPIFRGARNHHRLHVYYEWAGGLRHPPRSVPSGDLEPSPIDHRDGFDSP
jgi:hypothetical protein